MLTLGTLLEYTNLHTDKVNPTGRFSISNIVPAPSPFGNALAIEYTFQALTDESMSVYKPIIVFVGLELVHTKDSDHPLGFELFKNYGIYLSVPRLHKTPVMVQCGCKSYYYEFWFWNKRDGSHSGGNLPPYTRKTPLPPGSLYFDSQTQRWRRSRPRANAQQSAGLCKHLLRQSEHLFQNGWIKP